VARVKGAGPILSRAVDAGKLKVVGGVYELGTGKVEIVA
jgi:carbonic anhydrase